MSGAPTFSIVTVSFNQAEYLQDCIESVVGQTFPNVEYIVVDPGSTDGSRDIISKYAAHIDHIVLDPDQGPADGLNKGFAMASGTLCGYINADDRLAQDALRFAADYFAAHPDVDVLSGAIRIIDERGQPSRRKRTSDRFSLADYAAGICTVGQQATFFRRTAFDRAGGFNPENRTTWDGELLVDMALAGCRFETVHKILGDFRIYPSSITGSNRFRVRQAEEFELMREKMRAASVSLHTPFGTVVRRLLYKASLSRHIGYLTVR